MVYHTLVPKNKHKNKNKKGLEASNKTEYMWNQAASKYYIGVQITANFVARVLPFHCCDCFVKKKEVRMVQTAT